MSLSCTVSEIWQDMAQEKEEEEYSLIKSLTERNYNDNNTARRLPRRTAL